jgi:predicted DNA-binding ribbon-helix-helix protein
MASTLDQLVAELSDERDDSQPLTQAQKVYLIEGMVAAIENCQKAGDEITAEILIRIRAKLIRHHQYVPWD